MSIKEFNERTVGYFDYHWFWGLQGHKTEQSHGLVSDIQVWGHDPDALRRVITKQERIDSYALLVRFFYWLFNLQGYAADFYKLAAFHVCGEAREDEVKVKAISERVLSSFKVISKKLHSVFTREKPPSNSTQEEVEVSSPLTTVQEEGRHVFEISEEMQPHLSTLGIVVASRERVEWQVIREAYKARAKETHPDRSGGVHEAFLRVKEAYDALYALAFLTTANNQEDLVAREYYERVERLFQQTRRLSVELDHVAHDLTVIARDQTEIARDQAEIARGQTEIARDQAEIARDQAEIARDLAEIARAQERNHSQLVSLLGSAEANIRTLEWLRAEQEERGRNMDRLMSQAAQLFSANLLEPTGPVVPMASVTSTVRRSSSMQFFSDASSSADGLTEPVSGDFIDMSVLPYH